MCAIIAGLKLEIKTGMKAFRSGSTLKACQQIYGVKAKTKQKALDEMLVLYKSIYGWEYGSKSKDGE
jgi:hypothetical protein